ncbi:uncharacterized protein LOC131291201 [Anopheles ziemanni]|uniref:uncharacterized protein LOC131291201 n=1 Tax=Anopheles ziemanni TaxID=345580 RepID=UPI00265F05B1|nr:uncharacterized protein LOC131291201 [Anopheles ziemanni]
MSSSLSAMPFARQYGSFRATTTTNGSGTGNTTSSSSSVAGGLHHHSRYSSGAAEGGTTAGSNSSRVRLQMAPLSGYRLCNQVNRTPTVSTSSSSSTSTSGNGSGSSSRQSKYSQQAASGGTKNQENIPTATGRPSGTVSVAPAAAAAAKLNTTPQHSYNSSAERCAVHHHRGTAVGGTKKVGELIGDSPLLQSPRIIARSARIVEPNAWNRRLTASNFCSPPVPASHHFQSSSNSGGTGNHHHLSAATGQRLPQAASLVCRKSPGSSGTSVESIVPKYTRTTQVGAGGGAALSTVAQKRTYNAQKPQLRIVSSRTLANTSGRIGAGGAATTSIASRKTGGTTASVAVGRPMAQQQQSTQGLPTAAREVAKVLQHHHHHHHSGAASMRVIDVLNNNHLQHQQPSGASYRPPGRAQAGENIENHHPHDTPRVETATANRSNGGLQKHLASSTKKQSAIPQRLPLTLATDQLQSGAASFSSKFPNGLPFEQEFYYRRPPPAPAHRQDDQEEDVDEEQQHADEDELEGESDGQEDVKMREENGSYMPDSWRNTSRKMKKVGSTTRTVALGGGRAPKEHHHQRNRSESTSEDNNTTLVGSEDVRFVDFPNIYPSSGGLQQLHRRHQTRHELELEKDKHKQQQHYQRKQDAGDGDNVVHSSGCPMTSVVEYRHINHSNYYYKFESVRSGAAKLGSKQHQQQQRKLLQRRPSQVAANGDEEDERRRRRTLRLR